MARTGEGGVQTILPQNFALARAAAVVDGAHTRHAAVSKNNASDPSPTSGTADLQANKHVPSWPFSQQTAPPLTPPGQKTPL